jgi:hypothetical protein
MLPLVCQSCSFENESGALACHHCGCPNFKAAELLSQPLSHPFAWRVYSVFVIVVHLGTIVMGGLSMSNVLGGFVSFVFCLPLVGYAWQRALVPRWVGKVAFVLGLLCLPIIVVSSISRLGVLGFAIAVAILVLYAPFYRAAFLYGYRSNHLWSAASAQ